MKLNAWYLMLIAGIGLLSACSSAPQTPSPTAIINPTGTLEPVQAATDTPTATQIPPTQTPLPTFTATAAPSVEPTATLLQVDPVIDVCVPAPVELDAPQGWQEACYTLLYQDVANTLRTVPVTFWRGSLSGGEYEGRIVLLWGYESLTSGLPGGERSIFADSLRMLRLVVFSTGCNVGTNPTPQTYPLGDRDATGTTINVIDCPDAPDTRGWFAGVVDENINFSFFMYADPLMPAGHPAEQ